MGLHITEEAAKWLKDEMGLENGDYVQFFLKIYGGIATKHPNYFLGVSVGLDGEMGINQEVEGITFYFNEKDNWFVEEYDMNVKMGEQEVEYEFNERG